LEPITASAIATLGFTKAFEKTIENLTEAAFIKIDELRKKIWDKLQGNGSLAGTAISDDKPLDFRF
jgi:hypothetical protein